MTRSLGLVDFYAKAVAKRLRSTLQNVAVNTGAVKQRLVQDCEQTRVHAGGLLETFASGAHREEQSDELVHSLAIWQVMEGMTNLSRRHQNLNPWRRALQGWPRSDIKRNMSSAIRKILGGSVLQGEFVVYCSRQG